MAARHDGRPISDGEIRALRSTFDDGVGVVEVLRPHVGLAIVLRHDPAYEEPAPRVGSDSGCCLIVNAGRSPSLDAHRSQSFVDGSPDIEGLGWPFLALAWTQRSASIVTDPLAGRAAWYASAGRTLIAASEPSSVLAHPGVSAEPDLGIVAERLINRLATPYRTVYRDLRAVPDGSRLQFSGGVAELERWHDWSDVVDDEASPAEWESRVLDGTTELLADHFAHAAPSASAVWLSGGLDSSAVAGVVRRLGLDDRVRVVARRYPGLPCDEGPFQQAVVAGTAFETKEIVHRDFDPERDLVEPSRARAVPLSGVSPEITDSLRWCSTNGLHHSITGVGGDELFLPFGAPRVSETVPRPIRAFRRGYRLQSWIAPGFARSMGLARRQEPARVARGGSDHPRRRLAEFVGDGWWAVGVENFEFDRRVFADEPFDVFRHPSLVQLAMTMPDRLRSAGDDRRAIQRRAFASVLPPELVARRSKVHFDYRHAIDLRHPWVEHLLSNMAIERAGLVVGDEVRSMHATLTAAADRDTAAIPPLAKRLWLIIGIEQWWRDRLG